jgi:hypothetical protein
MLVVALSFAVCLAAQPPPATSSTWPDDPPQVSLDQIRRALAQPPPSLVLVIPKSAVTFKTTANRPIGPDFKDYLHELFTLNTLQRQSADWASKGEGINLIELARAVRNAFRAYEERKIHDEVGRELEALWKANQEKLRHP